jgi:hypothetical protein
MFSRSIVLYFLFQGLKFALCLHTFELGSECGGVIALNGRTRPFSKSQIDSGHGQGGLCNTRSGWWSLLLPGRCTSRGVPRRGILVVRHIGLVRVGITLSDVPRLLEGGWSQNGELQQERFRRGEFQTVGPLRIATD